MSRNGNILRQIDWFTIVLWLMLALFGWMNIYGATYTYEQTTMFDFGNRAGKQFVWILTALVAGGIILLIDSRTYDILAYIIYAFWLLVLLVTPLVARDTKGSLSWINLGPVSLQPAEFAKCFTALALAKWMSRYEFKVRDLRDFIVPFLLMAVPMFIIMVLQKETGSALVFAAFLLMFYREGMTGYILLIGAAAVAFFILVIRLGVVPLPLGTGSWGIVVCMLIILIIEVFFLLFLFNDRSQGGPMIRWSALGIAATAVLTFGIALIVNIWIPVPFEWVTTSLVAASTIYLGFLALRWRHKEILFIMLFSLGSMAYCYSCDYAFEHILQDHQRSRIEVLLGLKDDPAGVGYNVNQSKIAIGSGRFLGKGFHQGTQTKLQFVPEQATDFIFCTVGEEWGFLGCSMVLITYLIFILRLIYLAERQRERFCRIYGYSVAAIFLLHLTINIGMVLGLLPVIGIPLPLFSYGGSQLWGFTILLFIFLKMDASRFNQSDNN
ncbi:MAG: rod shape-determining protein RodA [Paludibacteraceae bacterium]|nr:rod shape-determining protein RodA [Paludibacteraceae bacterium]